MTTKRNRTIRVYGNKVMAELVLELVELCAVMAEEHSASPSTTEHPSRVQPPPHSTPANPAEVNAGSIVQRFTFNN